MADNLMPVAIWIDLRFALAWQLARSVLSDASSRSRTALERHTHKLVQFVSAQPNA